MPSTPHLGLNIPEKTDKGKVVTEVFQPNFTKIDQFSERIDNSLGKVRDWSNIGIVESDFAGKNITQALEYIASKLQIGQSVEQFINPGNFTAIFPDTAYNTLVFSRPGFHQKYIRFDYHDGDKNDGYRKFYDWGTGGFKDTGHYSKANIGDSYTKSENDTLLNNRLARGVNLRAPDAKALEDYLDRVNALAEIVNSNKSENGYIQYGNGVLECWGVTAWVRNPDANTYFDFDFPVNFITPPSIQSTVQSKLRFPAVNDQSEFIIGFGGVQNDSMQLKFSARVVGSGTDEIRASWFAKGFWK